MQLVRLQCNTNAERVVQGNNYGGMELRKPTYNGKAKIEAISSDGHQLQFINLHHFKLERFKSIK